MRGSRSVPIRRLERLRALPMLGACSNDELRAVDALTCEVRVSNGRSLAREGNLAAGIGLIVEGGARVSIRGVPLFEIGPGSCYGATSALDQGPQDVTVIATRRTSVLIAGPKDCRELMRVPAVAIGLLQAYAAWSRLSTADVLQSVAERSAGRTRLTSVS